MELVQKVRDQKTVMVKGTARLGGLFGPAILVWLYFLAITGAVQVIQLGYLPRLNIRHTAATQIGQIYVAPVNWMLMVCTISLVAGFQSSSKLTAAYGLAVTSTMIINTVLFFVVTRRQWDWPLMWAAPLAGIFLLLDVPFFMANISKIFHGAWFPLVIGSAFFTLMLTWAKGRGIMAAKLHKAMPPVDQLIVDITSLSLNKIEGDAVYLTGNLNVVPVALAKNIKHNKVIHNRTIFLNFQVEDTPRIPNLEKIQTEKLGGGFHLIRAHYGFMENSSLSGLFSLVSGQGLDLNPGTVRFYIGRENLTVAELSSMARWRAHLFIFMSRNAADAASFFNLPPDQTIEVGVRLEI